jgi:exosortase A
MGRITVRSSLWAAGLFCLALLAIYSETFWSMVYIWSRSETFAHGFLILPISVWLIWTQRDLLNPVRPRPALWVALLLLPLGLGWLLAAVVDVAVIQQLALVAMLIAGTWTIIGHQLGRVLFFPLFFLFFAVPMGEGLIPPMMEFTATTTVWMIEMTGIPVYREGLFFSLPSGSWSVVEACSGVRYIIASVTVGTLFAYMTYRSWIRRILFVLVSAIVPVFANTLRAYIIVMLGHVSDMSIATGADHLVYGWVFFGLVIFVLFWLGALFREDDLPAAPVEPGLESRNNSELASNGMLVVALFLAVFCASLAPLQANILSSESAASAPVAVELPSTGDGWLDPSALSWRWSPPSRVSGQQSKYFQKGQVTLGLVVQYADSVIDGADVVGSSAMFALQDTGWRVVQRGKVPVQGPNGTFMADEAVVQGRDVELLVWSWYRMGEKSTSNDYNAKLQQILAQFGLSESGEYRITVATPVTSSPAETRSRLQNFIDQYASPLYEELRQAALKSR